MGGKAEEEKEITTDIRLYMLETYEETYETSYERDIWNIRDLTRGVNTSFDKISKQTNKQKQVWRNKVMIYLLHLLYQQ